MRITIKPQLGLAFAAVIVPFIRQTSRVGTVAKPVIRSGRPRNGHDKEEPAAVAFDLTHGADDHHDAGFVITKDSNASSKRRVQFVTARVDLGMLAELSAARADGGSDSISWFEEAVPCV